MAIESKRSVRSSERPGARSRMAAPVQTPLPSDPLERLQFFWSMLFWGVLERIRRHDPKPHLRMQLELERCGLIDPGEVVTGGKRTTVLMTRSSSAFTLRPDDAALTRASAFRWASPSLPSLKGRVREGRQSPPLLEVLMCYYKHLADERQAPARRIARGDDAPHQRAVRAAAKEMGYTSEETFRTHLVCAQRAFPPLVRLWRGRGAVWIHSG